MFPTLSPASAGLFVVQYPGGLFSSPAKAGNVPMPHLGLLLLQLAPLRRGFSLPGRSGLTCFAASLQPILSEHSGLKGARPRAIPPGPLPSAASRMIATTQSPRRRGRAVVVRCVSPSVFAVLRLIVNSTQANIGGRGDPLLWQFNPLRPKLGVQADHARQVASRPIQAGYQPAFYGVVAGRKDESPASRAAPRVPRAATPPPSRRAA